MSAIEPLLQDPVAQAIGWALIHFVWQGALIGALAAIALLALRRSAADVRYVVAAIALTLMEGDKYRAFLPADYILHLRRETGNRVEAAKKVNKEIQLWVQHSIIRTPRLDERTRTLVFFVNTGQVSLYHYTQVVYTKHHCIIV